MSFVLDDGTLRQVEDSSESITDSVCNGSVVGRPVPHLGSPLNLATSGLVVSNLTIGACI